MKFESLREQVYNKSQIHSVQMLRGIACLAVYFVHFFSEQKLLPASKLVVKASEYGYLGVQVFFVISGFIIPLSMYRNQYDIQNFGNLFKRRLVRIELPYVASIALLVLLKLIEYFTYKTHKPIDLDWTTVLLNIGYLNVFWGKEFINHAYWTLFVELQFYLYIGLFFGFITSKNFWIRHAAYLVLFALNYWWVGSLLFHSHILVFMVGIFAFQYVIKIIELPEMLLSCAFVLLVNYCWLSQSLHLDTSLPIILASIFAIGFIFLIKKQIKVLDFLGKISFSLYLIHVPVTVALLPILEPHIHRPSFILIYRLGVLIGTICIAYIYYRIIEKPAMSLSRKV
ncbi:MAG: acyltransferase family protein [Flectobacillus sp.]|uniref:acyltransferase family protein n=1 Tax=Flectobacillus sp. TaxID=50419 RepID=UPI003B9DC4AC